MTRSVDEWIAKSDDTPIPPRVKARIFAKHGGICHICTRSIEAGEKWDAEHVLALINGGENRESNLKPAHKTCHTGKSKADLKIKSKVAKVRQKHLGITSHKQKIQSPGFKKQEREPKHSKLSLPRRSIFTGEVIT